MEESSYTPSDDTNWRLITTIRDADGHEWEEMPRYFQELSEVFGYLCKIPGMYYLQSAKIEAYDK